LSEPTQVGDILKKLPRLSGAGAAMELARLQMEWERVIGAQVAKVTRPVSLKSGVLTIGVPGSVWANELHFVKKNIIAAANELLECEIVTDIRFKVISDLGVSSLIES
jgi:predicted nucleic acid-binding Zn ribbon protein